MNNSKSLPMDEKKRLWIFVAIAFGVTLLMTIPMYIGSRRGADLNVFASAQMFYPACGVILGRLLIRKDGEKLPLVGFIAILVTTVLSMALSIWSICTNYEKAEVVSEVIIGVIAFITYIIFWACGQEKIENAGIKRKNIKTSILMIALFVSLYAISIIISTYLTGLRDGDMANQFAELTDPLKEPMKWVTFLGIIITFPLAFTAFFGEEYGWRYYLQPLMQKKYGLIGGTLLLGLVWAIWHFNLELTGVYSKPGMPSLVTRIITCVTLAIFFAYAYMKTKNIWVPIIMHFLFNSTTILFINDMSDIQNEVITWKDVPIELVSMLVFAVFIFAPIFRKKKEIEPTE